MEGTGGISGSLRYPLIPLRYPRQKINSNAPSGFFLSASHRHMSWSVRNSAAVLIAGKINVASKAPPINLMASSCAMPSFPPVSATDNTLRAVDRSTKKTPRVAGREPGFSGPSGERFQLLHRPHAAPACAGGQRQSARAFPAGGSREDGVSVDFTGFPGLRPKVSENFTTTGTAHRRVNHNPLKLTN